MAASPFALTGRPRHPDLLTPAEWDVLAGVREGLTNRDIANQRECGLETVRFHLRNLRRKLRLESRDALRSFPGRPAATLQRARAEAPTHRVREQIPLLAVRDMARSLDFYVEALGFSVVARWPEDEEPPGWVALGAGAARLMLHVGHHTRRIDHDRDVGGTVTLSLYVEGLDAFRRSLTRRGHRCGDVKSLFYGAREFYLSDPDANEIAIVEFAASDPEYLTSADPGREKGVQR